jgi:hypothetical protein
MNGSITGEMLTVVKNEKIVQKWRLKHWPADVYSTVTIMLFQVDSSTCRCALLICIALDVDVNAGCRYPSLVCRTWMRRAILTSSTTLRRAGKATFLSGV